MEMSFSPPTDRCLRTGLSGKLRAYITPTWVVMKLWVTPFSIRKRFKAPRSCLTSSGMMQTQAPLVRAGYWSIILASKPKLA